MLWRPIAIFQGGEKIVLLRVSQEVLRSFRIRVPLIQKRRILNIASSRVAHLKNFDKRLRTKSHEFSDGIGQKVSLARESSAPGSVRVSQKAWC